MVRVFIGSSKEQRRLVEWLTQFMISEYQGVLEPVPWTVPWPGGRYTLETLLRFVNDTDAAILFWTADDKSWYRDVEHHTPRDNLVFEAGLFIAAHGRERVQLMVPEYPPGDERRNQHVPTDVAGLTYNLYEWADGEPERTGLPRRARTVCDSLRAMGQRPRLSLVLHDLLRHEGVEEVRTLVGSWGTIHNEGIQRIAHRITTRAVDILAAYRVGEIRRALDEISFRLQADAQLRACFPNMWDNSLLAIYRRKYHDRSPEHIRHALKESITFLIGECDIVEDLERGMIKVTNVRNPPRARYEIRLTSQRITYSFYRIDDFLFLVPLDMKKDQNPAPRAWVLMQEMAPRTFEHYLQEYERMFSEATRVFP